MGKKGTTKSNGVQTDIYGNPVHLDAKEIFRMVKCGKCGESVKLSQARLHLSFGKSLNICKKCLEEMESRQHRFSPSIRDPSKIRTIEYFVTSLIRNFGADKNIKSYETDKNIKSYETDKI